MQHCISFVRIPEAVCVAIKFAFPNPIVYATFSTLSLFPLLLISSIIYLLSGVSNQPAALRMLSTLSTISSRLLLLRVEKISTKISCSG